MYTHWKRERAREREREREREGWGRERGKDGGKEGEREWREKRGIERLYTWDTYYIYVQQKHKSKHVVYTLYKPLTYTWTLTVMKQVSSAAVWIVFGIRYMWLWLCKPFNMTQTKHYISDVNYICIMTSDQFPWVSDKLLLVSELLL